jgi:copper(I)-binding protein
MHNQKRIVRSCLFSLFTLSIVLLSTTIFSAELEIKNARAPEAPPVAPVMAGYMTILNHSNSDVTITAIKSSAFDRVELHSMSMKDGMMHMEQQHTFTIPAKGQRLLEPGGYHLMLIKPKKILRAGDSVDLSFSYQDKTSQKFSFKVK